MLFYIIPAAKVATNRFRATADQWLGRILQVVCQSIFPVNRGVSYGEKRISLLQADTAVVALDAEIDEVE